MKTRFERSAGGVVYRPGKAGLEIALAARRTRKGDLAWGLPKGLVEQGEGQEETAVREVLEETGLEARIEGDLGEIGYSYVWEGVRVKKAVRFFLMRATGGDVSRHDHEMEEVRWFPRGEAVETTTYPTEKDVVRRALEALTEGPGSD